MDPPPVQYVTTSDGYNIAYSVTGSGFPLVLMPFPMSHLYLRWQNDPDFIVPLASKFQLIQYDGRGQGMSSRGLLETHSLKDYVTDVRTVVDQLPMSRVAIWGDVFQTHAAMRFAFENPKRVSALVLRNPIMNGVTSIGTNVEELAAKDWPTFLKLVSRALLPFTGGRTDILEQSVTQEDWLARLRAVKNSNIEPMLASISCPTLVMATLDSMGDDPAECQRIASLIPQGRVVLLKNADLAGKHAQIAYDFILETLDTDSSTQPSSTLLSSRELEVLRLTATGKSNQQIADELVLSINTVARHVANILSKTGSANRTEAAAYARDKGLI